MAQENRNRLIGQPAPAHRSVLGSWQGETFQFASPAHERAWQQQAYRQSVHPDRWQGQAPVDAKTQAVLDGMPHLGGGQYFRGPDGRHRRITMEQREDVDVANLRRNAFNEYAQTGVTWRELAEHSDDHPHPGEDEALALMDTKRAIAKQAASTAPTINDIGIPQKDSSQLTRVAGDLDLDLKKGAGEWSLGWADPAPAPILVATTDKAIAGMPKEVEKAQPFLPPPSTTPRQRREYNESLVGIAANDNKRAAANDNANVSTQSATQQGNEHPSERSPGKATGSSTGTISQSETEEWAAANTLFNWSRLGNEPPAPAEYAVNAVSEAGRFTYLEEMKDEWSRLLEKEPEKVFRSMTGEAEKLTNVVLQDFVTGHHRQPFATEKAEIEDAVTKMVFAPAERWTKAGDKPNEKVSEPKRFLGIVQSPKLSGSELATAFSEAAKLVEEGKTEKFGGRPGSKETRRIIARVVKKLAKAIEACGGKVQSKFYGTDEKFLPSADGGKKGGSFADNLLEFEHNDYRIGLFGNHAGTYADGLTLKPNEANQIHKLVANIAQAMRDGTLELDAAGVGYFSKRKPGQSFKDYLRTVNDFVKNMIDCKRPFLIKIRIEKPKNPSQIPQNDNFGQ